MNNEENQTYNKSKRITWVAIKLTIITTFVVIPCLIIVGYLGYESFKRGLIGILIGVPLSLVALILPIHVLTNGLAKGIRYIQGN